MCEGRGFFQTTKLIWREGEKRSLRYRKGCNNIKYTYNIFDPLNILCQYSIKYKQTSAKNSFVPKKQSDIVSCE